MVFVSHYHALNQLHLNRIVDLSVDVAINKNV